MITEKQLDRALTGLAKAVNRAFECREIIMAYSMEKFGVTPGEIDNDQFIDCVDGGSGTASGMTVEEFKESMKEAIMRKNPNYGKALWK